MNHEMVMAKIKMHASLDKAAILGRFFKTGPGQYAAGDVFVGVMVPVSRKIAHDFRELPLAECEKLLASPIHEARLIALIILCNQFKRGNDRERAVI
jgi:hypothetical protein